MPALFKKSVTAALSLILGAGVLGSQAASVKIADRSRVNFSTLAYQEQPAIAFNSAFAAISPLNQLQNAPTTPNLPPLHPMTQFKYSTNQPRQLSTWITTPGTGDVAPFGALDDIGQPLALNVPPTVSEVPAPTAAWQSLPGLLLVISFTLLRQPRSVPASRIN